MAAGSGRVEFTRSGRRCGDDRLSLLFSFRVVGCVSVVGRGGRSSLFQLSSGLPVSRSVGVGGPSFLGGTRGAQPVAVGPGFDDVGFERDPVDDGGGEARIAEGAPPLMWNWHRFVS